jgi:hypothetical protein
MSGARFASARQLPWLRPRSGSPFSDVLEWIQENLIHREVMLPLVAVARIVAFAGAVQTKESGESVGT